MSKESSGDKTRRMVDVAFSTRELNMKHWELEKEMQEMVLRYGKPFEKFDHTKILRTPLLNMDQNGNNGNTIKVWLEGHFTDDTRNSLYRLVLAGKLWGTQQEVLFSINTKDSFSDKKGSTLEEVGKVRSALEIIKTAYVRMENAGADVNELAIDQARFNLLD
jgi:hypothetical protein